MNPGDLPPDVWTGPVTKALTEAVKVAGEFLGKVLNVPATELGEVFGDRVKYWRARQAIRLTLRIRDVLAQSGVEEPCTIPANVLIPSLEAGSLETDEGMRERWAALLANAADPESTAPVTPAFHRVLSEMTPFEVQVLDWMYEKGFQSDSLEQFTSTADLEAVKSRFPEASLDNLTFKVIVSNLCRLGVSEPKHYTQTRVGGSASVQKYDSIKLTPFGAEFVHACRYRGTAT